MSSKEVQKENKVREERRNKSRIKREGIKSRLENSSENTVIDRYILRDNKLIHLRKDKYKEMLSNRNIKFIEK